MNEKICLPPTLTYSIYLDKVRDCFELLKVLGKGKWIHHNSFHFQFYDFLGGYWDNLVIFGPIGLNIFMGTQETIIYQLAVKNPRYDAYITFLGHFWRENGRDHHARPLWPVASKGVFTVFVVVSSSTSLTGSSWDGSSSWTNGDIFCTRCLLLLRVTTIFSTSALLSRYQPYSPCFPGAWHRSSLVLAILAAILDFWPFFAHKIAKKAKFSKSVTQICGSTYKERTVQISSS